MRVIEYELAEKRLIELDKIANINEDVYVKAMEFVVRENKKFISNVDFSIYILFRDEIQFDFDHEYTDRYCKFELRKVHGEFQITSFMYENKNTYPIIDNIEMEDIFSSVEQFFKKII